MAQLHERRFAMNKVTRHDFLRLAAVVSGGAVASACVAPVVAPAVSEVARAGVTAPSADAADLIRRIRADLQPLMQAIQSHRYLDALEAGRVQRESLKVLAAQQYHIVTNGIMNIALMVSRFGNLPSRGLLNFFLQAEFEVREAIVRFAQTLGMDEDELKQSEVVAGALPFSYYETYLCFYRSDAELIAAFLFDAEVWINNARRISKALQERYDFTADSVQFFEMYANYQASDEQAIPPVQAALDRGVSEQEIRQAVRLLLEYELMFWDAMAASSGV
jgi:thiaminase